MRERAIDKDLQQRPDESRARQPAPPQPERTAQPARLQALEMAGRPAAIPLDPNDPRADDAARGQSLELILSTGARRDQSDSAGASYAGLMHTLQRSRGSALDQGDAAWMGSQLEHDFGHVRVHTDAAAAEAAQAANAEALTLGSDVFFDRGAYAPGSARGDHLLAHELQHVVQFEEGRVPRVGPRARATSHPNDALEREAEATAGSLASRPAGEQLTATPGYAVATAAATSSAQILRRANGDGVEPDADGLQILPSVWDAITDTASDAWDTVSDAASDTWDAVSDLGEDALIAIVERISPLLAEIARNGPIGYVRGIITDAISGWFGALFGEMSIGDIVTTLGAVASDVLGVLGGVASGDTQCCETFAAWMEGLGELVTGFIDNPIVLEMRDAFSAVEETIVDIATLLAAPAFDLLKDILGETWSWITAAADVIGDGLDAIRAVSSAAWEWVLDALGFDAGSGGIWEAIKSFAADIWDDIKATLEPMVAPLQVVVEALTLLNPFVQIHVLIETGTRVYAFATFLWENWDAEDLPERAEEAGYTWLPGILDHVDDLASAFAAAAEWLGGTITTLATGLLELASAATGQPLVSMASGALSWIAGAAQAAQTWCETHLPPFVDWLTTLASDLAAWAEPIIEVLTSIALCVAMPQSIPVVLAGHAWGQLPECIKGPVIDFLLDVVITALEAAPELLIFGPVWALLKPGLLGFLRQIRGQDTDTKVAVADKAAHILSGSSLAFTWGFVKGFLRGIWEGITDPFVLAWTLLKALGDLGGWMQQAALSLVGDPAPASGPPVGDAAAAVGAELIGQSAGHIVGGGLGRRVGGRGGSAADGVFEVDTGALPPDAASTVRRAVDAERAAEPEPSPDRAEPDPPSMSAGVAAGTTAAASTSAVEDTRPEALQQRAASLWDDLGPRVSAIGAGFMPAIREYFSGGEGVTFGQLAEKFREIWPQIQGAMEGAGAAMAQELVAWFMRDEAEGELGDTIGWLAGTIVFEVVLFYFTAGAGTAIVEGSRVLTYVLRFLDWTGEAFGLALKGLVKLGGLVKTIGSGLARMFSAATGRLKTLVDDILYVGRRLVEWAEETLAAFGRGVDDAAEHGGREATEEAAEETVEHTGREVVEETAEETTERGGREATEEAGEQGGRRADEVAASQKEQAKAIARTVMVEADLAEWHPALLLGALNTVAGGYRVVEHFKVDHITGARYAVTMIASKHELGEVDLKGHDTENGTSDDRGDSDKTGERDQTSKDNTSGEGTDTTRTTSDDTRQHVHEGGTVDAPQSPYHGKWDGSGIHSWKALEARCDADGYTIKAVTHDPATGVRRVEIEKVGVDPRTGETVTGTIRKTIYPKTYTPKEIDELGEAAFQSAAKGESGTKFDPPGAGGKTKKDGTPVDGYFESIVEGPDGASISIQGWFKTNSAGQPEITSHAPRYAKDWPELKQSDW